MVDQSRRQTLTLLAAAAVPARIASDSLVRAAEHGADRTGRPDPSLIYPSPEGTKIEEVASNGTFAIRGDAYLRDDAGIRHWMADPGRGGLNRAIHIINDAEHGVTSELVVAGGLVFSNAGYPGGRPIWQHINPGGTPNGFAELPTATSPPGMPLPATKDPTVPDAECSYQTFEDGVLKGARYLLDERGHKWTMQLTGDPSDPIVLHMDGKPAIGAAWVYRGKPIFGGTDKRRPSMIALRQQRVWILPAKGIAWVMDSGVIWGELPPPFMPRTRQPYIDAPAAVPLTFSRRAEGRTLEVGDRGMPFTSVSSAYKAARTGDTILVHPLSNGTPYKESVGFTNPKAVVRVVGAGPHSVVFDGDGVQPYAGKGIFVIAVSGMEFRNITGQNMGLKSTSNLLSAFRMDCHGVLRLIDCTARLCQNGVGTSSYPGHVLLFRNLTLDRNGTGSGADHNAYIGVGGMVMGQGLRSTDPTGGHAFKSKSTHLYIDGRWVEPDGSLSREYGVASAAGSSIFDIPEGTASIYTPEGLPKQALIAHMAMVKPAKSPNNCVAGYAVETTMNGAAGLLLRDCRFELNVPRCYLFVGGGVITYDAATCSIGGAYPKMVGSLVPLANPGSAVVGLPA